MADTGSGGEGAGRGSSVNSWGEYDRKQLARDCSFHRVRYPFEDHLNVNRCFAKALGLRKPDGMLPALRRVSLPLQGTHHRSIDDARNIVRLLPCMLAHDGHVAKSPTR